MKQDNVLQDLWNTKDSLAAKFQSIRDFSNSASQTAAKYPELIRVNPHSHVAIGAIDNAAVAQRLFSVH